MEFNDYKFTSILLVIAIILAVIEFICIIINQKSRRDYDENSPAAMTGVFISFIFLFIIMCLIPGACSEDIKQYNYNLYTSALESGYTVYIDGTQVDGTKLDINHYKLSINDKTNEVYLTPKN